MTTDARDELVAEMHARAVAAVAGEFYGLGEDRATRVGLAEVLALEDIGLNAQLCWAFVDLTVRAVQGWAASSGRDAAELLQTLARPV